MGASLIAACDVTGPKLGFGNSCKLCHANVEQKDHEFRCVVCHRGDDHASKKETAHRGLIATPASPDTAMISCGRCHRKEVVSSLSTLHYTLSNKIGVVWRAFFPDDTPPASIKDLPVEVPLRTLKGLVADLLRRRCARCHLYSKGDGYPGTRRGLGCAACHMESGSPRFVHRFKGRVKDENCLSCHHGNFVGWDYVGRYDKDIAENFQVPVINGQYEQFSYGIQWLRMNPDIHWKLGYGCVDCHTKGPCQEKDGIKDGMKAITCRGCHALPEPQNMLGHGPGDDNMISCAVCHALWSFNDRGRTLVRQDVANYWAWYDLRFQGIRSIELFLEENYFVDVMAWPNPFMMDPLTGRAESGIWYETFLERRFWPVRLGKDLSGRIMVMRPLLDLSVIYVGQDGDILVEGLRPEVRSAYIPYLPHTIGKADLFRTIEALKMLGKDE